MRRTAELLFLLTFLCLPTLSIFPSRVRSSSAADNGKYQEDITLAIGIVGMEGYVSLSFTFMNVSGLFDPSSLANDPTFIMTMIAAYKTNGNYATLSVATTFNSSLITVAEGKAKADAIANQLSSILGILGIPYQGNFTYGNFSSFSYVFDTCPIEIIHERFFNYIPSQGFAELLTPSLDYSFFSFALSHEKIYPEVEGELMWTVSAYVIYSHYLDISPGHEYHLSLRTLMNYSKPLQASPDASNSTIHLGFYEDTKKYKFQFLEIAPQMEKTEQTYENLKMTMFTAQLSPDSTVEDVAVHFKIVSPNYIDPATLGIGIGVGAILVTAVGVVVYKIRKKRKTVPSYPSLLPESTEKETIMIE